MLQMMVVCIVFLIVALLGLKLATLFAEHLTGRPVSFKKLLQGLEPKLWMSAGLGIFFACCYVLIVFLSAWFLKGENGQKFFNLALQHPIFFVYGGLTLFVLISLSILVVRGYIKKIYNKRR